MAFVQSLSTNVFVLVFGLVLLNCFSVDKLGSHAQVTQLLPEDEVDKCFVVVVVIEYLLRYCKSSRQYPANCTTTTGPSIELLVGAHSGTGPSSAFKATSHVTVHLLVAPSVMSLACTCLLPCGFYLEVRAGQSSMNIVLIVRPELANGQCCMQSRGYIYHLLPLLFLIIDFLFSFSKLKGFNLTGVLPSEFRNLTHLREIDLTRNYLNGSIPASLAELPNLQTLSLIANRLTGSIPREFGSIATLESLTLEDNLLGGSLHPDLGNLRSLKKL
ncbi:hypothetical protein DKX38_017614 [Salix brachista]|uniref:Leucine-rich repeat-containing N-terminal plant-type domain-containing protein n=1 Tax=Salix brachista TaxID=2182728 RepID=A0A5N5KX29_9ROSI|nr:hypothetical protein DKX38_017612 [Salix brachista]KAB5534528.1 hypothetical protein DKX38_017614 [Salix brachista]